VSRVPTRLAVAVASAVAALVPSSALGHGIGEFYTAPIPLRYYLLGAGYTVGVSFLMLTMLLRKPPGSGFRTRATTTLSLPTALLGLRVALGAAVCVLVIGGFVGTQDPGQNLVPWLLWVLLLVGLTLASLLVGNLWEHVNPWQSIVESLERAEPARVRIEASAWIAPLGLALLFWWELVSGTSFRPVVVASVLVGYTLVTIAGGRLCENWFRDADPVSSLFRLVGSISPLRIGGGARSLELTQPTAAGGGDASWPDVVAIAVLLGGASFDSLKETLLWFDGLRALGLADLDPLIWGTAGLLGTIGLYVGCYLFAIRVMAILTGDSEGRRALPLRFVWSLVPVAVGYTLAHNFPLTVLVVPYLVAMASDPFALGWDLFGTAGYRPGLLVGVRTVWFTAIALVILGHVGGVWLGHRIAQRLFHGAPTVARSQVPLALLMVVLTGLALWLLAQPLVESP